MNRFTRKKSFSPEVLSDITLHFSQSSTVAVVGKNGSGKSTLLRIINGTLYPSSGTTRIQGTVGGIIDLYGGIDPNTNGYDNLLILVLLNGCSLKYSQHLISKCVAFSGLSNEDLCRPTREYSLGMLLRLSFAAAVAIRPDILIVDEMLAVGDLNFQWKCRQKIQDMVGQGSILLLTSHDSELIRKLCDTTIYMEQGRINTEPMICPTHYDYVAAQSMPSEPVSIDEAGAALSSSSRIGSGLALITSVTVANDKHLHTTRFTRDDDVVLRLAIDNKYLLKSLYTSVSLQQVGQSTAITKVHLTIRTNCPEQLNLFLRFKCISLAPASYYLSVGLHNTEDDSLLDSYMKFCVIVIGNKPPFGDACCARYYSGQSQIYCLPKLASTSIQSAPISLN